jgi:LmbE family N-acetylglucosaminyl deacetylase
MAVHAHPDDEASSGGILALYADQGVRIIVVTCTNGEFGDAPGRVKPGEEGHDPQAVAQIRLSELRQSVNILGVTDLETLGYHDSGMPDWEYKDSPEAFWNVPLEEVAGRIGDLIEKYRPQVLVTYDDEGAYQHPDHVHASRAGQAAAVATGIPAKVYLSTNRASSWRRIWEALFAHGSQISESWFSKLPQDVSEEAFGYQYFIRVADTTQAPLPETDLFAGLRTGA